MTTIVEGGPFEMDSREVLALTFDVSAWLTPLATIVPGTPELRRISDGLNYATGLRGSPSTVGHLIAQELQSLEPDQRYWLILPFQADGATFSPRLQVNCRPT